jgi:predicted Zn finger-like uncharacterized protein
MVIECTECRSRFRIADDKLKPGGTKVRCTKCKQIFTVHPPAEAEDATLFGPAETEEPGADEFSVAARQEPASEEFSFDAAPETPAFTAEQNQEQNDDFSADSFSADFSFEIEDPPTPAADTFSLGTGGAPDRELPEQPFSFGDDDQETSLGFDADDAASSLSLNFTDVDQTGDQDDDSAPADDGMDGAPAAAGFDFSLEDSADYSWQEQQQATDEPPDDEAGDDFDFSKMTFGGDDEEEEGESSTRSAPPFSPPRAEAFSPPPPAAAFKEAGGDEDFDDEPFPEEPARRSFPWAALLLLPMLIVGGGAGYFYWADGTFDLERIKARFSGKQPQTASFGQVRLADLNGGFVENAQLGSLFVVHGKTVNDFPETRSAISVKGILFNDSGKPLLQQTAFAGNPLDEAALRTLPLEKIEEHMNNQFGDSLSNLNIAPGKSIPFTIVFKNLPADLAEFTVEVVDSKPVSR